MSQSTPPNPLSSDLVSLADRRLAPIALALRYPPTPAIAAAVRVPPAKSRLSCRPAQLAWAALVLLALVAALLAVPSVRAGILDFLQIGDIRLFPERPAVEPAVATTPPVTPPHSQTYERLVGIRPLAEVQEAVGFDLKVPTYPPDLGPPDIASLQYMEGEVVILVWLEPDNPEVARLILYALDLAEGAFAGKFDWSDLRPATVHGQPAYWVQGRHFLQIYTADGEMTMDTLREVASDVLVWEEDGVTYRLETSAPLEEAIRIAESMR
jgi:hypothetical protein